MSRDREPSSGAPVATPSPATPPAPAWPSLPVLPSMALALLATAVVAALLAGQAQHPSWLAALALLLTAAGTLISGAFWGRQRGLDRLREARMHAHLLGQLVDVWCWQTDDEHRLVKLQPPQGAPASAWVAGAFSGAPLWQRFDDPGKTLQARLRAQTPLGELQVQQLAADSAGADHPWALRGLPRFDGRGRFCGYLGVAWPTAQDTAQRIAQQGFEALLMQGPTALCLAGPAVSGTGWVLQRANPAACALLGLAAAPDGRQPWAEALAGLPEGLRQRVQGLAEGQASDSDGWRIRLDALGLAADARPPGPASPPGPALLLALAPVETGNDPAHAALLAEHAAFSYTISHDLRAPIRVVEGFGRILKEVYGAALDRVGRDHLDRVLAAAARMNHMIDALLSLSRLSTQPLAQQPVNLSQLAQWVVDDLQRAAPDRQVALHIAPGLSAMGDPTLLRMALDNLLGNAWKYSAKVARAQISFEAVEQAGQRVYAVRDNGAGFDMRFADRLFGVFQRLHSSSDFPGTGVGLASVRRIIRRHGGEIWAEGEVGCGACFYFRLGR